VGVPIYAAATVVSFIEPLVALALYVAIAVFYAVVSQGWSSPRRRTVGTRPSA
jgi:hypothetical protein